MTEKTKFNEKPKTIKRGKPPKRNNPPVFPMNIAVGISKLDKIMIVDLIDTQSSEPDLASFSFALTKNRAEQLLRGIEKFLFEYEDEDEDEE